MPTFAPVRPYYAPPGTRRVRQGARLSYLGDMINPFGVFASGAPPPPAPPGLPAGYNASTGMIGAGASGDTPPAIFGPAPSVQSGAALAPGTFLTYTVTYALQGVSNFFTSNDQAISSIGPMLAGVGLAVVSVSTPSSLNPFSNNTAVIGLQVQGGGMSLQSAKGLCDNAIVAGIGAQIISSSIAPGQANSLTTWISQNWVWLALGAGALLIAPRIFDDLL